MRVKRPSRPSGRDADTRRTIPLQSARWQRLRALVLARQPLCRDCNEPATDVDHDNGDPGDNSPQNLVARCHSCHSRKTMMERSGTVRGCDVEGWPTSPASHWNGKSLAGLDRQTAAPSFFHRNEQDTPPDSIR
ncbi:MAG: HNH endonuclease [Xanthomonadales bacterium]|nr:HNH endonuclease [Xanthomonadales bacterium]